MNIYKILNKIFNPIPYVNMYSTIKFIAKIKTAYIISKNKRRVKFYQKYSETMTNLFGYNVLKNAKSVGPGFYCGGWSYVSKNTIIKNNVCFNGLRMEGDGNVTIGSYFHSGTECLIITRNHNYDTAKKIPYDEKYIYKDIEIEDFVWLGSRVTILPGTKIGEGAIIQGGSVVHGKIPPYAIVGGNPAKVFKYRDIEHFKKLKSEGKFY